MKTCWKLLLTSSVLLAGPLCADWISVFAPDFSQSFVGEGADQFNYVGSAFDGEFVQSAEVVEGRFRMVTGHTPDSSVNHSLTRLSRHGNASPVNALDLGRTVALLRLEFRWKPTRWDSSERSLLGLQIGENFRTGAYNPARGGKNPDGPAFASLNLQALPQEGRFRFALASGGGNSQSFAVEADADGFHVLRIAAAFNNTAKPVTITAPGGNHTLQPQRLSVWNGDDLVWDNHSHPRQIVDVEFQHMSIGFGNGINRSFEAAEPFGGIYEIGKVEVLKWRE